MRTVRGSQEVCQSGFPFVIFGCTQAHVEQLLLVKYWDDWVEMARHDMTWVKWETIHTTVYIYLDNKIFESMSSGMGGSTIKYSNQGRFCKRSVTWVEHWTSKVWVISGKNIWMLIYKTPILKEYSSFFMFFFFKKHFLLLLLNYMCMPL